MARVIVHIDMDAFFASIEQHEVPGLRGCPVAVCGDPRRRSVVVTASYEARRLGLKAGLPVQEARRIAPEARFVEGDPSKYISISLQILNILCRFSPRVEPYSIDEAFLDISGCPGWDDPASLGERMKAAIREATGLGCTVGIGQSKLAAKMATGFQKPDGLTIMNSDGWREKVWPLDVSELHGIGAKTSAFLHSLGIRTIGQLAAAPEKYLRQVFGVNGTMLWESANGIDLSPVDPSAVLDHKSCGHEFTFSEDTRDEEIILSRALFLSENVARQMRRDGYKGRTINLKLRDACFRTFTRAATQPAFTDDANEIYREVRRLLERNWREWPVRLVGVSVSGLFETARLERQLELFDFDPKRHALIKTLDRLWDKYGETVVVRAAFLNQ